MTTNNNDHRNAGNLNRFPLGDTKEEFPSNSCPFDDAPSDEPCETLSVRYTLPFVIMCNLAQPRFVRSFFSLAYEPGLPPFESPILPSFSSCLRLEINFDYPKRPEGDKRQ